MDVSSIKENSRTGGQSGELWVSRLHGLPVRIVPSAFAE